MKAGDLFRISIQNLWVRKLRTGLNVVGIVLSCVLLLCTLSATSGIRRSIEKFVAESDEARRFPIYPDFDRSIEPPEEITNLPADISPRRRKRLQKVLEEKWRNETQPKRYLIPEATLQSIREIDHVIDLKPSYRMTCGLQIDEQKKKGLLEAASLVDKNLQRRVIAGRFFEGADSQEILIHELLAFELGFRSDSQLQEILGKTIQVQFRSQDHPIEVLGETFFRRDYQEQTKILDVMEKLLSGHGVESLDQESVKLVREFMNERNEASKPRANGTANDDGKIGSLKVIERAYRIVGVYRNPDEMDPRNLLSRFFGRSAQLLVHYSELSPDRLPLDRATRVFNAEVFIDDIRNLDQVTRNVASFDVRSVTAARQIQNISRGLDNARTSMVGVVAIILLISAIGISNTMIISLVERTEEIGILKAVGASNRNVMALVLLEGTFTGVLAGLIAVAVTLLVAWVGNHLLLRYVQFRTNLMLEGQLFVIEWWMIAVTLILAMLVTTLAGLYPAWRAARLDPVVAMGRI